MLSMRRKDTDKAAAGPPPDHEAKRSDFAETTPVERQTSAEAAARKSTAEAEAWVDQTLGKYRVIRVLGRGAMGVVLKAHDPMIERDVAIKVLTDHLSADATALARFLAEAKAAGKVNHPNVAAIYEICQQGEMNYLVLEYVPGGSLEDRLREHRALPLLEATQALIDACKGVGAAHAAGLIHRDIKPANFMRAADGSIKVADFGLAKSTGGSSRELTQTGTVVGTPFYMSPEQCEAKPLDQRSDVYSLGATYYTLLTGRCPFDDSDSVPQLMYAHCHGPIPDPRSINPAIPEACARIIASAMTKAPADRYQSTAEMLADLQAVHAALSGQARIDLPSDSATVAARAAAPAGAATLQPCDRRSRRRYFALAVGIFLAGAATAAWMGWGEKQQSNDNATDTTDPAAPVLTATAPGVTAADITLGMSAPFSGPAKELGRGMQIGIETYLKHVNLTAGGIHGRKLKLLALDDGYEPERCQATMKEMIEERPVFAFLGNVGTVTTEAVLPLVLEHKRVFFGAFTGTRILRRDPPDRYVFNYRAGFAEETAAIVQYLLTIRGIKSDEIAVFDQDDRYGNAGFNGVARALRKAGFDDKRIIRVRYERNSMNLDKAVSGLLQHKDKIKAVVMVPTYRQAAAFIKRIKDGGMDPIFTSVSFVSSDALAEELKELGAKYTNGIIVTQVVPYFGSSSTGVLEYRERLARYFPAEYPGFVSLEGYIAARALCAGLEKVGPELTTERLVDALESIHDLDFGIGAKISFGPSTHQASHKVWAAILDEQGKFRNLDLD
jgi:ABC-type branched-subunit amino acid transport system substrate-binding protein/tRNA A-37 threonylcarbamoyl transferase component Bud32